MSKNHKYIKTGFGGFSLMELIIVVVIVGIITAFSIPNYRKSKEKEYEKAAIQNLKVIHNAQLLYRARTDSFWTLLPPYNFPAVHHISPINASLNVNIIEDGFTYECYQTCAGCDWACTADRNGIGYSILIRDNNGVSFVCCETLSTISCPSLTLTCT